MPIYKYARFFLCLLLQTRVFFYRFGGPFAESLDNPPLGKNCCPRRWERTAAVQEILKAHLSLRDGLRMVGLARSQQQDGAGGKDYLKDNDSLFPLVMTNDD